MYIPRYTIGRHIKELNELSKKVHDDLNNNNIDNLYMYLCGVEECAKKLLKHNEIQKKLLKYNESMNFFKGN